MSLSDCLLRLVDANITDQENEPKGQKCAQILFQKLPLYTVHKNLQTYIS